MNVRDAQGQTPLHLACERGEVSCVQELLEECQARTDIRDKNGDTPMHCAAKQDSAVIVEVSKIVHVCRSLGEGCSADAWNQLDQGVYRGVIETSH